MIPAVDYIRILPELVLSIFGIIVMMVDPVLPEQGSRKRLGIVAVVGTLAALAATAYQTGFYGEAFTTWSGLTPSACSSMWSC